MFCFVFQSPGFICRSYTKSLCLFLSFFTPKAKVGVWKCQIDQNESTFSLLSRFSAPSAWCALHIQVARFQAGGTQTRTCTHIHTQRGNTDIFILTIKK